MRNTRLVYFLRHMSPEQLEQFSAYLRSPSSPQRPTLIQLYDLIREDMIEKEQALQREEVYQYLYPGQVYNPGSLKTMFSQLFAQLKRYLAHAELEQDKHLQQRLFLRASHRLGAVRYHASFHKSALAELEKSELNTADYFFASMALEEEHYQYLKITGKRTETQWLDRAERSLHFGYLCRMLRYQLRRTNLAATYGTSAESEVPAEYVETGRHIIPEAPPVLEIYRTFVDLHTGRDNPESWLDAFRLLGEYEDQVPRADLTDLYTDGLNHHIRALNAGELQFRSPLLELYKKMLDLRLIIFEGRISPFHFKNIIVLALQLEEISWAEKFFATWHTKLTSDHARNAVHFNRALLHFSRQEYAPAERLLNLVLEDFQDIFYGLGARGYLLQIYYETKNITGLEAQINSYRMYLQRLKMLRNERKQPYIQFINHLRRLLNIRPGDEKRLRRLKRSIEEKERAGMGTDWLLAKIGELLGE